MNDKKFITYGKGGRARYHKSRLTAKIRAMINKDVVDVVEDGGKAMRTIDDYRRFT